MNILRSLARDLLNTDSARRTQDPGSLSPLRQKPIAQVIGLGRFHDAFEQLPQGLGGAMATLRAEHAYSSTRSFQPKVDLMRDGFEAAARAPVNLSGHTPSPVAAPVDDAPVATQGSSGFSASLDDLAGL